MASNLPSRISLLLDAVKRINTRVELASVLGTIMDAAKSIMDAEASSLMMLDPQSQELIITLPTGPVSAEISGLRIPPGKGFAGWVASRGEPLVVNDARNDPRFFGDLAKSSFRTRNLICVPLRNSQGHVTGVLQAVNRKDDGVFEENDIPLFSAFADQAAIAIEKSQLYQTSLEKERLEQQLLLAREIQVGFWPKQIPCYERVTLAGKSWPASQVGGDYYDVVPIDSRRCSLIVADVSGKGIPAAMIMAAVRGALRTQLDSQASMSEITAALNRMLVRDTPMGKFLTLFWSILDVETLELTYTNAGHNPAFVFSPATGAVGELSEGGPVLGVLPDLAFTSSKRILNPGDLLVMYTDGIVEAQNLAEEMYGNDRLLARFPEAAACDAQGALELIERDVNAFSAGAPQYDDATLIVAKIKG
ncbi:MAG: GAF domain-containing protein [Acidobacteria bacterium]|nr:MAG: GAF domain-containing protein [Acidobacteriota bacterium]